jgi:hypothetical protein
MPKISVPKTTGDNPLVEVVREDINNALARLDYLFSGRLDDDNLLQDRSSGKAFEIPTKTAVDYPDQTRPVNHCMKFFAHQSGEDNFYDDVFSEIHTEFINNPDLILLTGSQAWSLSREVLESVNVIDERTGRGGSKPIIRNQFTFNKPIIIDKPPNIVPITNKELFEYMTNAGVEIQNSEESGSTIIDDIDEFLFKYCGKQSDNYVIMPQVTATADYPTGKKADINISNDITFSAEQITLNSTITVDQFDESDFLNFQLVIDVLCKVLR